jgi:hypothetical protein
MVVEQQFEDLRKIGETHGTEARLSLEEAEVRRTGIFAILRPAAEPGLPCSYAPLDDRIGQC